ncbi:helix-turn-helix transcriptional regulator [Chryseobacterium sp. HMWF035]|uniref:helix-turn-helix transcriptional regulator n=2 Tax=Chryseobacterium group TaxID=2782232 RepID=UPI000D563AD9|nr:Two component regulator three Y domain-containing protein [Chryseobacterium sp. HMWF035]PVV57344.1 Two component regulator three Y domain-containing protein [Chryseobacterium sp. HMWF035]
MIYKLFFDKKERGNNNFENDYNHLLNRYLLFLFFIFLFYSIFIITFYRDIIASVFLTLITLFWILMISIEDKVKKFHKNLKISVVSILVMLTLIVSFFNIYTSKMVGMEYFYFSILFAIPFFFNYRKDKTEIYFLAFFISFNFIACLYYDFNFLPRSKFLETKDYITIKLFNIIFSIVSFLIDMVFISKKDELINGLIKNTKIKDSTIEDLMKTNTQLMKNQMLVNHLTDENIDEIFRLAEKNSSLFFEKFQIFFPGFIPAILKINPNLIHSELYFCALMKLDFDTKKIAQCTNNSIRAVESKKYRIRKKLNIPSDTNINSFLLRI